MPEVGEIKQVYYKESRKAIWVKCPNCGEERWMQERNYERGGSTGLCIHCFNKSDISKQARQKGQNSRALKVAGNRHKMTTGYIVVRLLSSDFFHPMCQKHNKVFEHRLVMAKHLNRCLLPWEVVHHKNGVRDDNRLENLELLPTAKYHLVDIVAKSYIHKLEEEVSELKKQVAKPGLVTGETICSVKS